MALLDLTAFNATSAGIGGFAIIFCLVSHIVRETLYISEPLPSVLFGVLIRQSGWYNPNETGDITAITRDLSRFVLGIQLTIVGVQLPAKYLAHAWQSIAMLLVPVMSTMWVVSALIIYLCIPNISFLEGLIIGACVTPTDPVLSNSLVTGKFAERHVATELRRIIVAESGANDGFGYPFLFLALCIYRYSGTEIAKQWLVYTVCYEILLGVAYGAVVGYVFQEALTFALKRKWVDHESMVLFVFGLSVFTLGTAGLLGIDDLLACFVAGNLFTWNDEYRLRTEKDSVQPTADFAMNILIFIWIGATAPWSLMTELFPIWRLFVMGIFIMLFRRLPALLVFYKWIPTVVNLKEAFFMGFFGPIGVGALFYLEILIVDLEDHGLTENDWLVQILRPIIYFCILSSVETHGFAIPVISFYMHCQKQVRHRLRAKKTRTDSTDDADDGTESEMSAEDII